MGFAISYIHFCIYTADSFAQLIHSILLHSQDMKPHQETGRVKPTVSIECKGLENIHLLPSFLQKISSVLLLFLVWKI